MEGDITSPASFQLGDFIFKPSYNVQKKSLIKGYGLIIQIAEDEFIVSGNACTIGYESADSSKPTSQLLSVEEGKFVNGKWVKKLVRNEIRPSLHTGQRHGLMVNRLRNSTLSSETGFLIALSW
jgi:hypothetical protein